MLLNPFYMKWPKRQTCGEAVLVTLRAEPYLTLQDACKALVGKTLAKSTGGVLIVHLDDSDPDPLSSTLPTQIFNMLSWLNLEPDEHLDLGGYYPYARRERYDSYQEVIHYLIDEDKADYAFFTTDKAGNIVPDLADYDDDVVIEHLSSKQQYTARLRVKQNKRLTYTDPVWGEMQFESSEMDHLSLLTVEGMPMPCFANVVDNHFMQVTTHIRSESALETIAEELVLHDVLGWERPLWLHVPQFIDPEIHHVFEESTVDRLFEKGYHPKAIVEYLEQLLLKTPGRPNQSLVLDHDELRELSNRHYRGTATS